MGCEELVKYVRCVCVWLGAAWVDRGEWMRGLGLGFTNPVGTGVVLDVCLCFGGGGVGGEWVWGFDQGLEWCCVDGRSRYLCIVLDGYLRI